jgi:hypothetical protein
VVAEPILDLDRLRKYKLVLTNYEAVRDYEFSFAHYTPEGKSYPRKSAGPGSSSALAWYNR